MPSLPLSELILGVREEILTFSTDLIFRDGNSTDPRNGEVPVASVSITRQINKAIADILIASKFSVDTFNIATVASQQEYDLPVGCADVLSVRFQNQRLRKTNITDLDARQPNWRTLSAGTPLRFYLNGTSKIGLVPAPGGTTGIVLTGIKDFTPLVANTDVLPLFPTMYSYVIQTRAAWHCAKLDAANPNAQARATILDDLYKQGLQALVAFMTERMTVDADAPTKLGGPQ